MTKLPVENYKNDIVESVRQHAFTLISAETGSGKSTQIPQYLAEHYSQIIVTEPRIMAAKTLATRVAEEMDVTLGEEVGYRTSYDKCASESSKILYCTDGLQLIRTIFTEDNKAEKVLIIDEVHEWNLNIETLIAWCKFMQNKWNTKVVLMSATMDATGLAEFFGEDCGVLNIPGTLYEVEVEERPKETFIATIKENIRLGKNILVFTAGKKEISDVMECLYAEDATVLPLHGELDWEEQKKCFAQYPHSKVIVATNVAQTSITIPDIDVVVDSGEAKLSIAVNGIQGLFLKAISQADIEQRKGRAGRTKEGKYFLCSDLPIDCRDDYTIPEINRSILDRVVLQIAVAGLDAEELDFYHQPKKKAILSAKKELTALGAFSGKRVTELGYKMVRIPVSVQLARMIIEAEKYGVTEPVMIISAIIEMGGLLAPRSSYYHFTNERDSDLLAELDVWNVLNKQGHIDFESLGIRKKNFFKIKTHIRKMRETLTGIVELTNKDDRDAIVKSCLCGLVSHVYIREYSDYVDENGMMARLNRNSCIPSYSNFVVGIPRTVETRNFYDVASKLNILTFATAIDEKTLFELVPASIHTEESTRYSSTYDSVEVTVNKSFAGRHISTDVHYEKSHPDYAELKEAYEKKVARYEEYEQSVKKQEAVIIDGKVFKIQHGFWGQSDFVDLDMATLFTTTVKEVKLDSGKQIKIGCEDSMDNRKMFNIVELRNIVEMQRVSNMRKQKAEEYESLNVSSIEDATAIQAMLGKQQLTMNNGGYGDTPILVYGYLSLKKGTVTARVGDDEETAKTSTAEAIQYLFLKKIEKSYGAGKFSHQEGKKKKVLTSAEMEVKSEFDSLVREVVANITVETALESLEFVDEYYHELVQ